MKNTSACHRYGSVAKLIIISFTFGMEERTNGWKNGRTDERKDGRTDERMDGRMGDMDGWMDGRMDGWTDGRTDICTDVRVNGWTDGREEGRKEGSGWGERGQERRIRREDRDDWIQAVSINFAQYFTFFLPSISPCLPAFLSPRSFISSLALLFPSLIS
jgi:hypothetical protein